MRKSIKNEEIKVEIKTFEQATQVSSEANLLLSCLHKYHINENLCLNKLLDGVPSDRKSLMRAIKHLLANGFIYTNYAKAHEVNNYSN